MLIKMNEEELVELMSEKDHSLPHMMISSGGIAPIVVEDPDGMAMKMVGRCQCGKVRVLYRFSARVKLNGVWAQVAGDKVCSQCAHKAVGISPLSTEKAGE